MSIRGLGVAVAGLRVAVPTTGRVAGGTVTVSVGVAPSSVPGVQDASKIVANPITSILLMDLIFMLSRVLPNQAWNGSILFAFCDKRECGRGFPCRELVRLYEFLLTIQGTDHLGQRSNLIFPAFYARLTGHDSRSTLKPV
jgi:hypothetical protein